MFDAKAINAGVNLVDLVGQTVTLRHISGDEWAGPCPKCGGRDRFHVTPKWAFCRQCWPLGEGLPHDAIGFVQWRDNSAFSEACGTLGGDKSALQAPGLGPSPRTRPPAAPLPTAAAPGDPWQARGRSFLAWAELQLWGDPQALAYLRGRGLRDETIRAAGLGYCPKAYRDKAAAWGLDPADYDKGVYIPLGWVIPCEAGGTLAYVKVRRPQGDPKYLALAGSRKQGAIYGLDQVAGAFDLVICEGELSALSLAQELAGVAAVISPGDAGGRPTAAALATMATVPRWWAVFDQDGAGDKGAKYWGSLSARVRPLSWPEAWAAKGPKWDVNDALRDHEDLAAWAVPQLGPTDPSKRRAWALHWLNALWDPYNTPEDSPVFRTWRAILDEYMALGPEAADLGAGDPSPVKQQGTAGAGVSGVFGGSQGGGGIDG